MAEVFVLRGTVIVNQKEVNMQLKEIEKSARETGRTSEKELKRIEMQNRATARAANDMAKKMISLAVKIAAALGAVRLGKDALGSFKNFEEQMRTVYTLLPGISGKAMLEMEGQVKSFSKEFGVLPQELIPSLYNAISAGVPKENVFSFLETAQKAAVGGVTQLNVTVDGLTSVVNAYGAELVNAAQASDILFQTMKVGKTDMAQLSQNLYNVTPVAAALDVTFSDVGAGLAAITAQGVPTATATVQMRQMFSELSKESSKTAQLFEQIAGKSFKQFIAEGGNTQEALQLLEKYAKSSDIGINDLFSSVQAGSAALALTGQGTDKFSEALASMANASGATDEAYKTMAGALGQAMKRIGANLQVLLVDLGQKLEPMARAFANWLEESTPEIQAVAESVFNTIGGSVKWLVDNVFPPFVSMLMFVKDNWIIVAMAIGTAITVLIIPALKKMGQEAKKTATKFAMAFGPLGAILTVAATLIGFFVQAWVKDMGGIQEKTKSVFNIIGVWFQQLGNGISKIWNTMLKGWYDSILWIIDKAKPLIGILPKSWQESIKGFEEKTKASSDKAGQSLDDLKQKGMELADDMSGAKDRVTSAFSSWETKTIETTDVAKDASDSLTETWGGNTEEILQDVDATLESLDNLDKKASEIEAKWRAKLEDQAVDGNALAKLELERQRAIKEAQEAGANIVDIEAYYANERAKILDEIAQKQRDIDQQIYEQQLKAVDDKEKLQEIELEKELERLKKQGATVEQLEQYKAAKLLQIASEATKEREKLSQEQADAEKRISDNLYKFQVESGQISLTQQLNAIKERLENAKEGSDEWLSLKQEELKISKQIADDIIEAEKKQSEAIQVEIDKRKKIIDNLRAWQLQTGERTREDELFGIRQRLKSAEEGSDEWLQLMQEEARILDEINADKLAKEQAYYELRRQLGQVNYEEESQRYLAIYADETTSYEERMKAAASFYNLYKDLLKDATDKEKEEIIKRLQVQLEALDETEEAYKELAEAIKQLIEDANQPPKDNKLLGWVNSISNSVENSFKSAIDAMTNAWSEGLGVWQGMLRGFGSFVGGIFKTIFDGLVVEMAKALVAQNSWVISALANIAVVVSGYIAQAYAALTAFYWFLGPGAPAAAGVTIAAALAAIAALGITVSKSLGLSAPGTPDAPKESAAEGKGTQVSEITGASRDLLVSSLAPLASLDSLVGIGNRIYDKLADIGDALLANNTPDLAGIGTGVSVTIEQVTLNGIEGTVSGVSDALVDTIEEKLSSRLNIAKRGGGLR